MLVLVFIAVVSVMGRGGSAVNGALPASRPTATTRPPTVAASTPTPAATTASTPRYAFPVAGTVSYARTHHDYPATDIIAACGSAVRAVTDGVVLEVNRTDVYDAHTDDGADRGGLFVSLLGDDGVRYYGSHLSAVAAGINPGVRVKSGQVLGTTGDSGDASACHLHFGISPPCAKQGDWWNQRGTLYPWPYLDSWRAGGQKSPVAAVQKWHKSNGCPAKPTVDG